MRQVIVISGRISTAAVAKWAEDGRSVILVNREMPDAHVGSVQSDNVTSSRDVADHLYSLGLKRAAYVGGAKGTPTSVERERAFTQRLAELGMTLSAVGGGLEYSHQAGFEAALEVWKTAPDAIFFASDRLAIGGLFAMRNHLALQVPQDVSLIGFDDVEMAGWSGIDLTTVRQDVDRITEETMELLTAAMQGDDSTIPQCQDSVQSDPAKDHIRTSQEARGIP